MQNVTRQPHTHNLWYDVCPENSVISRPLDRSLPSFMFPVGSTTSVVNVRSNHQEYSTINLAKRGIFLQLKWNIKLYFFDFGSW